MPDNCSNSDSIFIRKFVESHLEKIWILHSCKINLYPLQRKMFCQLLANFMIQLASLPLSCSESEHYSGKSAGTRSAACKPLSLLTELTGSGLLNPIELSFPCQIIFNNSGKFYIFFNRSLPVLWSLYLCKISGQIQPPHQLYQDNREVCLLLPPV